MSTLPKSSLRERMYWRLDAITLSALALPVPPKAAEVDHGKAKGALLALQEHEELMSRRRMALSPKGGGSCIRLIAGYATACLILFFAGCLIFTGRGRGHLESSIITGIDERDLAQAVGWIICGGKLTASDGLEVEGYNVTGSGFSVSPDGYLLTNKHVVMGTWEALNLPVNRQANKAFEDKYHCTFIPTVWVFFGEKKYVAQILYLSPGFDFAVLKIERKHMAYFSLSNADSPPRGTKVRACGFPAISRTALTEPEINEEDTLKKDLDLALQTRRNIRIESRFKKSDFEFDMTTGVVSRPVNAVTGCKWIQHDATIHKGNSGGPLISNDGAVVGINTLKLDQVTGVQRALSLHQLRQEIDTQVPGVLWK